MNSMVIFHSYVVYQRVTYKTWRWWNLECPWCSGRTCRKPWLLFACLTDLQSFLNCFSTGKQKRVPFYIWPPDFREKSGSQTQQNRPIWAPPAGKQRSLGSEASEICHLNWDESWMVAMMVIQTCSCLMYIQYVCIHIYIYIIYIYMLAPPQDLLLMLFWRRTWSNSGHTSIKGAASSPDMVKLTAHFS